jgi:ribonuclease P/MRP protein subunit POP5
MDHIPVKNGQNCSFRVVRVSGTIRKAEEEAIRRARQLILRAKEETAAAHSSAPLSMFAGGQLGDQAMDVDIVDGSEDDDEEDGG